LRQNMDTILDKRAQVVGKLSDSFSLQLDESTDVSGNAQLVAFVRYADADDIYEHILFCKSLEGKTTGEDIFIVDSGAFCEYGWSWKSCSSICTDAAASMTGRAKGLIARKHCQGLFSRLCENMGVEHTTAATTAAALALSLSRENTQPAVGIKIRSARLPDWAQISPCHLVPGHRLAGKAVIWQIFSKLNELNTSLQGKNSRILNLYDKVGGFLKKAALWRRACAQEGFTCFPQLEDFLSSEDVDRAQVKMIIVEHLTKLIQDFHSYFPDMEEKSAQLDWVTNPFLLSEANRRKLPVTYQEKLLEVSSDRGLQMKCSMCTLSQFWVYVKQEHHDMGQKALEQLSPFASAYLCEASFSATTLIREADRV
uniref:DUF4371 domain-containing protein n=1 Tax=Nothobranchius furzeri TaxID=105023 RepID=A0A8C6LL81_NOTFU